MRHLVWAEIHLRSREYLIAFGVLRIESATWDHRVRRLIIDLIIARPPHASSFPSLHLQISRQHVDSSSSLRRIFLQNFYGSVYYPGRSVEAKYKLTQDDLYPTCVLLGNQ